MHNELVLIDQAQLRQRERELHTSHEQSVARPPFELLNGLAQIPAHEFRVPIAPSGIRFYRVPAGRTWRDLGEHVQTVSWHYRYAVVAPSTNPADDGRAYCWHDHGLPCGAPAVAELPELPEEWVRELDKGAAIAAIAAPVDVVPLDAETARKRIAGVLTRLQEASEGSRNNTLNWAAHLVGGLWARVTEVEQVGDLDADALRDTIEAVARDLGLTGGEVAATLASGWDAGVADPMRTAGDRASAPTGGLPPVDVSNSAEAAGWLLAEIGRKDAPLAGLFQRGNGLVHVPRIGEDGYAPLTDDDEDGVDGPAQVREVGVDRLRSEIQFRYVVTKQDKSFGTVAALFPAEAAKTVANGLDHAVNLRLLRGVTHTPMLREDGSVLDSPGRAGRRGQEHEDLAGREVPGLGGRASSQRPSSRASGVGVLGVVGPFPWVHGALSCGPRGWWVSWS